MTLSEFVKKYDGKQVDFDGVFGSQCFTKEHCVLMADYTYKPIADVKIGDKVIGYDNNVNNDNNIKSINTFLSNIHSSL